MSQFVQNLLFMGFIGVCVLMVLTVLIQRPAGGGLSGAFGSGAGSGQTAFGAKTGDALTIATILIFVTWLGAAITLNFVARPAAPVATTVPAATSGIPAGPSQPAQPQEEEGDAPADEAPAETQPEQAEPEQGQDEPADDPESDTTEQPADGG